MASLVSRSFTILRGLIYSAGFVWLWTWLAMLVKPLDARIPLSLPRALRLPGLLVALAGGTLAGLCIATFVTSLVDQETLAPRLVVSRPILPGRRDRRR
jgi:hypothetical protein